MKTTSLVPLLLCFSLGASAQGVVQFRTSYSGTTPPVNAQVFYGLYGYNLTPLSDANRNWRAALIGGPVTSTPANVPWSHPGNGGGLSMGNLQTMYNPTVTTLTWTGFSAPPNAGYVYVSPGTAGRAVPGVDWGGTALVQMVAWEGNYNTWQDAFSAFINGTDANIRIGASNPLMLTLPPGPASPTLTYLVGLQSFTITVPEPAGFALAALGAVVWIFKRRKNDKL